MMQNQKKFIVILVPFLCVLFFAGCGKESNSVSVPTNAASSPLSSAELTMASSSPSLSQTDGGVFNIEKAPQESYAENSRPSSHTEQSRAPGKESQNDIISSPMVSSRSPASSTPEPGKGNVRSLQIQVGTQLFSAALSDNATTRAFLEQTPRTVTMSELNGNEKYFYFSDRLPAAPQSVETIHAGDLMLYGSDCLVLFYKDFPTSYQYTKIGRIENPAGLADALGNGSVSVTFQTTT